MMSERTAAMRAQTPEPAVEPAAVDEDTPFGHSLYQAYQDYCSLHSVGKPWSQQQQQQPCMSMTQLTKMMADLALMAPQGPIKPQVLSAIHSSYKPLGASTLTFGTFLQAVAAVSAEAQMSPDAVFGAIATLAAERPWARQPDATPAAAPPLQTQDLVAQDLVASAVSSPQGSKVGSAASRQHTVLSPGKPARATAAASSATSPKPQRPHLVAPISSSSPASAAPSVVGSPAAAERHSSSSNQRFRNVVAAGGPVSSSDGSAAAAHDGGAARQQGWVLTGPPRSASGPLSAHVDDGPGRHTPPGGGTWAAPRGAHTTTTVATTAVAPPPPPPPPPPQVLLGSSGVPDWALLLMGRVQMLEQQQQHNVALGHHAQHHHQQHQPHQSPALGLAKARSYKSDLHLQQEAGSVPSAGPSSSGGKALVPSSSLRAEGDSTGGAPGRPLSGAASVGAGAPGQQLPMVIITPQGKLQQGAPTVARSLLPRFSGSGAAAAAPTQLPPRPSLNGGAVSGPLPALGDAQAAHQQHQQHQDNAHAVAVWSAAAPGCGATSQEVAELKAIVQDAQRTALEAVAALHALRREDAGRERPAGQEPAATGGGGGGAGTLGAQVAALDAKVAAVQQACSAMEDKLQQRLTTVSTTCSVLSAQVKAVTQMCSTGGSAGAQAAPRAASEAAAADVAALRQRVADLEAALPSRTAESQASQALETRLAALEGDLAALRSEVEQQRRAEADSVSAAQRQQQPHLDELFARRVAELEGVVHGLQKSASSRPASASTAVTAAQPNDDADLELRALAQDVQSELARQARAVDELSRSVAEVERRGPEHAERVVALLDALSQRVDGLEARPQSGGGAGQAGEAQQLAQAVDAKVQALAREVDSKVAELAQRLGAKVVELAQQLKDDKAAPPAPPPPAQREEDAELRQRLAALEQQAASAPRGADLQALQARVAGLEREVKEAAAARASQAPSLPPPQPAPPPPPPPAQAPIDARELTQRVADLEQSLTEVVGQLQQQHDKTGHAPTEAVAATAEATTTAPRLQVLEQQVQALEAAVEAASAALAAAQAKDETSAIADNAVASSPPPDDHLAGAWLPRMEAVEQRVQDLQAASAAAASEARERAQQQQQQQQGAAQDDAVQERLAALEAQVQAHLAKQQQQQAQVLQGPAERGSANSDVSLRVTAFGVRVQALEKQLDQLALDAQETRAAVERVAQQHAETQAAAAAAATANAAAGDESGAEQQPTAWAQPLRDLEARVAQVASASAAAVSTAASQAQEVAGRVQAAEARLEEAEARLQACAPAAEVDARLRELESRASGGVASPPSPPSAEEVAAMVGAEVARQAGELRAELERMLAAATTAAATGGEQPAAVQQQQVEEVQQQVKAAQERLAALEQRVAAQAGAAKEASRQRLEAQVSSGAGDDAQTVALQAMADVEELKEVVYSKQPRGLVPREEMMRALGAVTSELGGRIKELKAQVAPVASGGGAGEVRQAVELLAAQVQELKHKAQAGGGAGHEEELQELRQALEATVRLMSGRLAALEGDLGELKQSVAGASALGGASAEATLGAGMGAGAEPLDASTRIKLDSLSINLEQTSAKLADLEQVVASLTKRVHDRMSSLETVVLHGHQGAGSLPASGPGSVNLRGASSGALMARAGPASDSPSVSFAGVAAAAHLPPEGAPGGGMPPLPPPAPPPARRVTELIPGTPQRAPAAPASEVRFDDHGKEINASELLRPKSAREKMSEMMYEKKQEVRRLQDQLKNDEERVKAQRAAAAARRRPGSAHAAGEGGDDDDDGWDGHGSGGIGALLAQRPKSAAGTAMFRGEELPNDAPRSRSTGGGGGGVSFMPAYRVDDGYNAAPKRSSTSGALTLDDARGGGAKRSVVTIGGATMMGVSPAQVAAMQQQQMIMFQKAQQQVLQSNRQNQMRKL